MIIYIAVYLAGLSGGVVLFAVLQYIMRSKYRKRRRNAGIANAKKRRSDHAVKVVRFPHSSR